MESLVTIMISGLVPSMISVDCLFRCSCDNCLKFVALSSWVAFEADMCYWRTPWHGSQYRWSVIQGVGH